MAWLTVGASGIALLTFATCCPTPRINPSSVTDLVSTALALSLNGDVRKSVMSVLDTYAILLRESGLEIGALG